MKVNVLWAFSVLFFKNIFLCFEALASTSPLWYHMELFTVYHNVNAPYFIQAFDLFFCCLKKKRLTEPRLRLFAVDLINN